MSLDLLILKIEIENFFDEFHDQLCTAAAICCYFPQDGKQTYVGCELGQLNCGKSIMRSFA